MPADTTNTEIQRAGSDWLGFLYDPRSRGILFQILLIAGVAAFIYWIADNTITNLKRQNIASGFGFLEQTAGFDISMSLVTYENTMSYGRAAFVGLLNTLLVAILGIVLATVIGFLIGIARLSHNWLISRLATGYVEIVRNIPLLLQLFFWYHAVLGTLPHPRDSHALPFSTYLNNRGLTMPEPVWAPGSYLIAVAFLIAIAISVSLGLRARRHQLDTGERPNTLWPSIGLILGLPALAFFALGMPVEFNIPTAGKFNITGGLTILPEFIALLVALSVYTAAFIAEVVRAGILGISKGQKEAAAALGLRPGLVQRLVVIPQAMRIIIPPMTNQYLNLTKNSSLAVAIGYPDIAAILSGTILNQTNQALECVSLTMLVYLIISLATAAFMNWFNARMALVER